MTPPGPRSVTASGTVRGQGRDGGRPFVVIVVVFDRNAACLGGIGTYGLRSTRATGVESAVSRGRVEDRI